MWKKTEMKQTSLNDYPEVKKLLDAFLEKESKEDSSIITAKDALIVLTGCVIGIGIINKGIDKKVNKLSKRIEELEKKMEDKDDDK